MIPQIKEIKGKFPNYATLSQATVTLNDMGDKTITAQVKIDGSLAPDFSYDWEVEFKGERYIQPLREPQASKGNESICSVIDLVFQHKTIYDLKRYYFAKMAEVQSGTVSVDKYIADLNLNLEGFCDALQQVLDYYLEIGYFNERITIDLKGKGTDIYTQEPQYVQIQYTHIWDVVQKIYDLFGVRWSIEGREIKIGYPTEEVAHTFEYGFEGGLLKVERQVQSADIRNSLLGRGGSKNLPYRYFKEADPQNPSFPADPDAIPELANIYFTELRGKTFRDYVKGWKAKHYGGEPMQEPTEAYTKGYTDTTFNPIEYVEDKVSIAKYGLLQGGLENQEDIYPTIQGVEVDGLGRVDEIVGAEQVTVDEPTSENPQNNSTLIGISATKVVDYGAGDISSTQTYTIRTESYKVSKGRKGVFMGWYSAKGTENIVTTKETLNPPFAPNVITQTTNKELKCEFGKYKLFNANTNAELITSVISDDMEVYAEVEVIISGFTQGYDNTHDDPWAGEVGSRMFVTERNVSITVEGGLSDTLIHGIILDNYEDGERISGLTSIVNGESSTVTIQSLEFEVPEDGATNVDVPINIIVDKSGEGLYEFEKTVKAVNVDTNEVVSSINIPQGKYYLRVSVDIRNNSTSTQTYKVELMPSYIYYPTDSEEFKPTFYIYVKNIWNTTRNEGESNEAYTNRVWTPILGDREGNEAKVVFTTGWLAGHSDYEFVISDVEYAGGKGVQSEDGIPAEWKITLIKSDAEIEATGKWIPSTTQQANKGDKFFFIGIDMPHEYTLWAEQAVDNYKADQLLETAHIKPTWVVQTDKVRLNQLQPNETEPLLNALKIGNSLRLADTRFTNGIAQTLYLQSVTYTWDAQTSMHPNVEVVLSDKVVTTTNPVAQLQGEVDALTKQVGSLSNIQQIVRTVGDKAYLRKDGIADTSNSETTFNKPIHSHRFQQGAIGGRGWGLREENGKGIIEADTIIARYGLQVNNLIINQIASIAGTNIISAANMECSKVEMMDNAIRCYFDQRQGSISNHFVKRDIAFSQVFSPNNVEIKYYKREVIDIGSNYIDLSTTNYDGDGVPQEGDTIVQMGNFDDTSRQGIIIISSNPVPSITQYQSVNSFTLPTPITKISPNDNEFTGKVHIGAGSTGVENIEGLPEIVQEAVTGLEVGGQNLLRNSGFTGDYLSEQLADNSVLDATNQMFNPPFVHWEYSNATIQDSTESASGKEVVLNGGYLSQSLDFAVIANESYTLSFKAKGQNLTYNVGGVIEPISLTNEWVKYTYSITTVESSKLFKIENASCVICELQLERGTIPTAWSNSPFDNSSDRAYYQSLKYLNQALNEGSTTIDGGLVLTSHIKVGDYKDGDMIKETGGMQGTWGSDNSPFLWGGGTHEQALDTIDKYTQKEPPTDAELANMAKFVVTHGGRAILNDIILRGYIYAKGGEFVGMLTKRKKVLDDANIRDYFQICSISDGQSAPVIYAELDLLRLGSYIEISKDLTSTNLDGWEIGAIMFPTTENQSYSYDEVRAMVGNEVIIYNYSNLTFNCVNQLFISEASGRLQPNMVVHAKCTLVPNDNGEEQIRWIFTNATIKTE